MLEKIPGQRTQSKNTCAVQKFAMPGVKPAEAFPYRTKQENPIYRISCFVLFYVACFALYFRILMGSYI